MAPSAAGVSLSSAPNARITARRSRLMDSGMNEQALVAFHRADPGERDAGVAAGGFDDDGIGAQRAGALRRLDHRHADAILDAGARAVELQFCQHLRATALRDPVEPNQRGIADKIECALSAIFMGILSLYAASTISCFVPSINATTSSRSAWGT